MLFSREVLIIFGKYYKLILCILIFLVLSCESELSSRKWNLTAQLLSETRGASKEGINKVEHEILNKVWKPIYLRSQAQRDAGMPGGEGMQKVFSVNYAPSNPDIAYFVTDTSGVWRGEWKQKGSLKGYPDYEGFFWESKRGYFDEATKSHKGYRASGGISLAVDPKNADIVFVSASKHNSNPNDPAHHTDVRGIYRTLDGGDSWDRVYSTTYYSNSEGQHYIFDPDSFNGTRHTTVYAATHEDGLLKSTNGGDSWQIIGLEGVHIFDMEIVKFDLGLNLDGDASKLYLATEKGLFTVTDKGSGNPEILKLGHDGFILPPDKYPDSYPRSIALDAKNGQITIYAAVGRHKVFKSIDGGRSFYLKSVGLPGINYANGQEYKLIEMSKTNPEQLYIYIHNYFRKNPYYSKDGGETWYPISNKDMGSLSFRPGGTSNSNISTHPYDSRRALKSFAATSRIAETRDGGVNWRYVSNGFIGGDHPRNRSVYFGPLDPAEPDSRDIMFFFHDTGLMASEDNGDTWNMLFRDADYSNFGSNIKGISTIVGVVVPGEPLRIITVKGSGTRQVISRSDNNGKTWTIFSGGSSKTDLQKNKYSKPMIDENYLYMFNHPGNPDYIYAGGKNGSWISRDRGDTWGSWNENGEWTNKKLQGKGIRAVFTGNGDIVYAFEKCPLCDIAPGCSYNKRGQVLISRSEDGGVNWTPANCFQWVIETINDVAIDPEDSNRLYMATDKGLFIYDECDEVNDLDCTIDLDTAFNPGWQDIWKETGIRGGVETDFFVVKGGPVYEGRFKAIAVDPVHPNIVYAGKDSLYGQSKEFIYRSVDKGETWESIRYNLNGYSRVNGLSVDPATGMLYMYIFHGNHVLCTDEDADSYATEGGPCGIVDAYDSDPAINAIQGLSIVTDMSSDRIELKWTCATAVGSYNVYRSMKHGGPYNVIQTNHKTSECSYVESGLTKDKTYYYTVRFANIYGQESLSSNIATIH